MATPVDRPATTPASEAWRLLHQVCLAQQAADDRDRLRVRALAPADRSRCRRSSPASRVPMSALAGTLGCDNSNVTGIVDRLEDRGLVERRSAEHDRRLKLVHVTDAGIELRERLLARLYGEVPEPIARLSEEDQRALTEILRAGAADPISPTEPR